MIKRCGWVPEGNALYADYHDTQWGVPVHDDTLLFEMLILEGAQAGLSWDTILKKRANYIKAFCKFNPVKVASFDDQKLAELLQNEGIIRNRLKISSAVKNARAFLDIKKEFGSFDAYLWAFVGGSPIQKRFRSLNLIPVKDEISENISKDLKKRGMSFVGPTIMYAYMQAVGMVNAHTTDCFRFSELCPGTSHQSDKKS